MKLIITIIAFVICAVDASAQTNYYETKKTFQEDGYTYQCDVLERAKFVRLYNKENKLTYIDQIDRNSGKLISMTENNIKNILPETWTKSKCYAIVNNAFSNIEKQRVKGFKITICMYINPVSGKVSEVEFQFVSFRPYATIPVSVYRKIETELKKNVWFTPTAEGKKLNYIFLGWRQEVQ